MTPLPALPYILAVDDDANVLRAVIRDLRSKYASAYRMLSADSGESALSALRQLQARNDAVALMIVDQRMPQMTGVELLEHSLSLYPDSKRVLLTAYADSEAAIRAINAAHVEYYLTKPWDPPEERLYPYLDELLADWLDKYRPPFLGVRVVGHRWSPQAHALKEFLGRNQVPYRWFDVEATSSDPASAAWLQTLDLDTHRLPLVLMEDGTELAGPTIAAVAEQLGMRMKPAASFYDLVIVGAGPAGLAAAVYGASEGLTTVLIEREAPGGQAGMSSRIENYLGFPTGLTGDDLTRRGVQQARRFGVEILAPRQATGLRADGPYRIVTLDDGTEISSHAVLISTGLAWRKLEVGGLEPLHGAGVYYGATVSDAIGCKDEHVFLIGGANSAGQAAMHFARYARKVTVLVRGDSLTKSMSHYLIEQIAATSNIEVLTGARLLEASGEGRLESIRVEHGGAVDSFPTSSLYIFIGAQPQTEWLAGVLPLDERGFVLSGPHIPPDFLRRWQWPGGRGPYLFETGVPGVFVAGDVRHSSIKRVASSVGEGSVCVALIHQYLSAVK